MHHCSLSWEVTLLYFFSWNFIWSGPKEPIKVQKLTLLTAHLKFHQIYALIGSFLLKLYKISVKKVKRKIEEKCKTWRETNLLFQKWEEFGEFWFEHSKVTKICTLIGPFCKKVQRSYFSWHWRVMQNLKKTWLVCLSFLIGIHFMQGWTAATRHGVIRKRHTKRLKHPGNLFSRFKAI